MSGTPELQRALAVDPRTAGRRRFSAWTVVVPLALAACIYVVASIIGSARWSIGFPHQAARGVDGAAGRPRARVHDASRGHLADRGATGPHLAVETPLAEPA